MANRLCRETPAVAVWCFAWLVSAGACETAFAEVVYRNDFEIAETIGREWSSNKTDVTPKRNRRYLGQFGNHRVTLTIKRLPEHKYLQIDFDLFVIQTWDGENEEEVGPDLWQLAVKDGPTLVRTTFANQHLEPENNTQSYPAWHKLGRTLARTGAAENNTLGYEDGSSVYEMRWTFPHTAETIELEFRGSGLQELSDESWGLDNVVVRALGQRSVTRLDRTQLEQAWNDLAAEEAVWGRRAVSALIGAEDQAVGLLSEKLDNKVGAAKIERLIRQLDNDDFKLREAASHELKAMTPLLAWQVKLLNEAHATTESAEVRMRLAVVLSSDDFSLTQIAAERRQRRVRHVLELIGTDAARGLRKQLQPLQTRK